MVLFKSTLLALLSTSSLVSALPSSSLVEKRASRTSPPSGCLVVRASGTLSGEYKTVSSAVAVVGSAKACIFIYPGTYKEVVTIRNKGPLTFYGSTTDTGNYKSNTVTISNGVNSATAGSLDASATVNVASNDVNFYNINFANTYGKGAQAVALCANGERQGYYGCSFKGYQDTLYAKNGYQYYSNCYIEGAVDFIFGNAAGWWGECTIAASGGGYITATSRTLATDPAWYVFDHSKIVAASGASVKGLVFLGRPWRVNSRVIYQYSELSDVVHPEGWTTMAEGATPLYYEFQNTGAGASTTKRKYLTATTKSTSKSTLWPLGYAWIDTSY